MFSPSFIYQYMSFVDLSVLTVYPLLSVLCIAYFIVACYSG